jgi:glycerol kinase
MIIGLTRGTGKEHIARAALESIAFQSADLLTAMNADSHADLKELKIDGGATRNDLLLQFQSDILQIPVVRAKVTETTALGAAFLAGLSCGFWASTREVSELSQADRIFQPQMPPSKAAELKQRWDEAVERSRHWDKS